MKNVEKLNIIQPESNRVEYKRQLGDKFGRSVVAFLNYPSGGEILIGMDNDSFSYNGVRRAGANKGGHWEIVE
ncbi:MAG: ATP-binding protein [Kiritimatiellaeota bacterium]|nr:ATP-binding protein [Kiritimatiellota bacterium]